MLCVRLIFHTRFFHSEHNCLNVSQSFFQYNIGYNTLIQIQIIFITLSYSNSTFHWNYELCFNCNTNFISTCLSTEYFLSYSYYISHPYEFGHSLMRLKLFILKLSSNMNLHVFILMLYKFLVASYSTITDRAIEF